MLPKTSSSTLQPTPLFLKYCPIPQIILRSWCPILNRILLNILMNFLHFWGWPRLHYTPYLIIYWRPIQAFSLSAVLLHARSTLLISVILCISLREVSHWYTSAELSCSESICYPFEYDEWFYLLFRLLFLLVVWVLISVIFGIVCI